MKDLYLAFLARDRRFDGKFVVAVKTTGIYCRPICPARPNLENVEFFPDAAAAERAGYRPCMRCRPECAPLSPAWLGKSAVVQRALKLIARNAFDRTNEEAFAARLGVSGRHLRRLFTQEIGQTPKQIYDSTRLNFARKLIVETDIALAAIARTTGFNSLRRFNDAFQKRFRQPPSRLRKAGSKSAGAGSVDLKLSFRPPYDWPTLLRFYQTHPIPGVETTGENSFARVFRIGQTIGCFQVQPVPDAAQLSLKIVTDDPRVLFDVVQRVRRMFDLDSDPMLIASRFAAVPVLANLHSRFPGLRLPGGWDGYEVGVCAILGQLVSAPQRAQLVGQLVGGYGEQIVHPISGDKVRLFPRAETLAAADLRAVKTTAARKESIRDFSRRVLSGAISLSEAQDPLAFRRALLETKGLGPWSAECISLRALGDTDAFPKTDLILRRAVALHPDLDLEKIRPWRSYAAIYLWREFAHALSRPERSKKYGVVLQGNRLAGRQAQADRKRQRAGRCAMGTGKNHPSNPRRTKARPASPDLDRGGAAAIRVFRTEENAL
jgi:AraC family transcriptional regulator of adaptative response / DNA-3-methyladenine glycosylase II